MAEIKRLRIFAGPNGSGKSTLFQKFSENYDSGFYVNADDIEAELKSTGLLDLSKYNCPFKDSHLKSFMRLKDAQSLIKKVNSNIHLADFKIKDNTLFIEVKKN